MADRTLELRAILDSAERAAAAQDFASAAEFLRRAAAVQEAEHGSQHPDLANTFNNLGIVYEGLGQPADAEASYRKAYAIATATLAADDPLVVTSRQNLRDFCAASGRPFEPEPRATSPLEAARPPHESGELDFVSERDFAPEPVPPAAPAERAQPVQSPQPVTQSKPKPPAPALVPANAPPLVEAPVVAPVATAGSSRNRSTPWLLVAAGLVVLFVIAFAGPWSGSEDSVSTETPAPDPAVAAVAPQPVPSAAEAAPAPAAAPVVPHAEAAEKTSPPVESARSRPAAPDAGARSGAAPAASVADARVCRSLSTSTWRCTEATTPANPGVFFFYTRVKSARPTTVQHRWYRDGVLRRTVNLRIAANPSAGYRTYSRNTVTAERRGDWRVELRDAEGALLHEERLVVK